MNIHLRTWNAKLSLEPGCISIFTLGPGTKPGSDRRLVGVGVWEGRRAPLKQLFIEKPNYVIIPHNRKRLPSTPLATTINYMATHIFWDGSWLIANTALDSLPLADKLWCQIGQGWSPGFTHAEPDFSPIKWRWGAKAGEAPPLHFLRHLGFTECLPNPLARVKLRLRERM